MATLSFQSIVHALETFKAEAQVLYVDRSAVPELFQDPLPTEITQIAPDRFRIKTPEARLIAELHGDLVRFTKSSATSNTVGSMIAGGIVGGILGAMFGKKNGALAGAIAGAAIGGAIAKKQETAAETQAIRMLQVDETLNVQAENVGEHSQALYLFYHAETEQWIVREYTEEPTVTPDVPQET